MDNSKNLMNNDKSLCLYCDKAFSNINDQENHVERDHKTVLNKGKGSLRKSERITKNLSSENSPFAACFYCNNKKIIKSDDLETLFQHLLTAHKDIYFGCKCRTRVHDKNSLTNHRKNCKIGGGKNFKPVDEKVTEKRKSNKKSQSKSNFVDLKCDNNNLSETESTTTTASATTTATKNSVSVKTLPTNAINKKSDRNNVKNSNSKSVNFNDKRNSKSKIANSSSSSTISSASSSKGTSDEYTIPLTRQKLKEPGSAAGGGNGSSSSSNKHNSSSSSSTSTHNRSSSSSASNKKIQKNSKATSAIEKTAIFANSSASSPTKVQRTKTTKVINQNSQSNCESIETTQKNDIINTEFDDDFYKNISCNIRVNLNCYIDGKIDRLQLSKPAFNRISTNEDKKQSSQQQQQQPQNDISNHEKEIHEATNFELSTPFPALLTAEQYGFGDSNPNKNKRHITKNSWKWKWDLIKKYKYVNEGGKIVKKVKQITTGLKDLSQLDMWTQLSMRSRYENLNCATAEFDDGLNDSLSTRMIKTQNIEQLNNILDKRLKPEINIEQLQQTLVKEELVETEYFDNENIYGETPIENVEEQQILNMFKLTKTNTSKYSSPALSGEWARPRCFVCVDCGQEFDLMKSLNDHKNSEHPYIVSAHYEVVGRENLEQKLYKNLFLPKKALQINGNSKSISINSDSKSNEASSSSDNSSNFLTDQKEKECSKCLKIIKYSNDTDIYRHILDCIEDRVWMQAKKRSKYRRSRRKNKKNVRKSRLSTDQKKSSSSPFQKENTEGENSISNPPTPILDSSKKPISVKSKNEPFINETSSNTNDGMNIKSFFRVSKTTPHLPQKMVVQMLEMPVNSFNNSLRHSLRSSAKKLPNNNHNNNLLEVKTADTIATTKKDDDNDDEKKQTNSNEGLPLKLETISNETKNEIKHTNDACMEKTNCTIENTFPSSSSTSLSVTTHLPSLQICDSDKSKVLCPSPTNSNSLALVSPTSSSSVPKKKKKLNDCIAMLTCKIQEKLGVNFFENVSTEIFPNENTPSKQEKSCKKPIISSPPCISPSITISTASSPLSVPKISPIVPHQQPPPTPQPTFDCPEQNEVIDLSIKKKSDINKEKDENLLNKSQLEITTTSAELITEEMKTVDEKHHMTVDKVKEENDDKNKITTHSESESISSEKLENNEKSLKVNETNGNNEKPVNNTDDNAANLYVDLKDINESFKISISKDKIPNLDEILKENNVITVNNLKISESERRAFEEQKNRIMQILNKTKKTPKKKQAKKLPPVKKSNNRKNNAKELLKKDEHKAPEIAHEETKLQNEESKKELLPLVDEPKSTQEIPCIDVIAKSSESTDVKEGISEVKEDSKQINEPPKIESEIVDVNLFKASPKVDNIEKKIETAIKNTNRIRCRRLSVVVDPIIHLSAFQSSNRKIRLTNNSQQNGFYDLLTNDQLFNAIKPQFKDEIQKTVKSTKSNTIKEAIEEVTKALSSKTNNKAVVKSTPPARPKVKSKAKTTKRKTRKSKAKSASKSKANKAALKKQNDAKDVKKDESKSQQVEVEEILVETPLVKTNQCKVKQPEKKTEASSLKTFKEKKKAEVEPPKVDVEQQNDKKLDAKSSKDKKIDKVSHNENNDAIPSQTENDTSVKQQNENESELSHVEKNQEKPKQMQNEIPVIDLNEEIKQQQPPLQQKNFIPFPDLTDDESKPAKKDEAVVILKKNQTKMKHQREKGNEIITTAESEKSQPKNQEAKAKKDGLKEISERVDEKMDIVDMKKNKSKSKSNVVNTQPAKIINKNQVDDCKIEETPTQQKKGKTANKSKSLQNENSTIEKEPKKSDVSESRKAKRLEEKLSLDISLSSDASNENENDIPLAMLINAKKPVENDQSKIVEKEAIIESPMKAIPLKSNNKKKQAYKKVSKKKTQKLIHAELKKKESEIKDSEACAKAETDIIENVDELKSFEKELTPDIKLEEEKPDERISQKLKKKKLKVISDVFAINEDSFFNDDNDIDQADEKINDLVNNIINSSELIDSENEKNDKERDKDANGEKQDEAKCLICKRSFRNEKVLEKHNMTTTHLFKKKRREKRIAEMKEKEETLKKKEVTKLSENPTNVSSDETKIFRTKGALKTFDNILTLPSNQVNEVNTEPQKEFSTLINACSIPDVKEFIPLKKPIIDDDDDNNDDLSRKDKIFDSLFSNIENKLQAAANASTNTAIVATTTSSQKFAFPTLTPQDSEIESSSTSWDLKHDADIEWDGDNNESNIPSFMNAIKEKHQKKCAQKVAKTKESQINIPTKSLIMGKIFKKHRDREKQKTPQADAPNNKPGIKNSLDEIFDHLKNSAEIDDKVLTCPSPKTLLKTSGGTFSPHSSHSNDMLETASQSNNNNNNNNNNSILTKRPLRTSTPEKSNSSSSSDTKKKRSDESSNKDILKHNDTVTEEEEDGIGVRKSRRRCAIKTKTFAETWSSDEYEELHDTNDIISIINEIEKRESINKKRKSSKCENFCNENSNVSSKKGDNNTEDYPNLNNFNHQKSISILKSSETIVTDKKIIVQQQHTEKNEKKKSVQLQFPPSEIFKEEKPINTIRKRRMSSIKDGHRSDEETFTATKDLNLKPLKPALSMKKRRMSCFVPSTAFSDNINLKPSQQVKIPVTKNSNNSQNIFKKIDKSECSSASTASINDVNSEKCGKSQKKILSTVCNNNTSINNNNNNNNNNNSMAKKKVQKHRKRPRNKVKNIAYDSDSDFELNLNNKKSKASTISDTNSDDEDEEDDEQEIIIPSKINASQNNLSKSSNTNELTMTKEPKPKLLPNDLSVVQATNTTTTLANAAIPEDININDPLQSACNRTKRHSSEKLYYWSSSSSESDIEHGDTADGENEDSMIPQQPEQHGWIVGDSHKKLVTLLAHAKIKNKIN